MAKLSLTLVVVVSVLYRAIGPQVTDVSENKASRWGSIRAILYVVLETLALRHMKTIFMYEGADKQLCSFNSMEIKVR